MFLEISADLGCQEDAGPCAELTVLLVEFALQNQFFKVDKSHGHCRFLVAALILGQLPYLSLQAAGRESQQRLGQVRTERKRKLNSSWSLLNIGVKS